MIYREVGPLGDRRAATVPGRPPSAPRRKIINIIKKNKEEKRKNQSRPCRPSDRWCMRDEWRVQRFLCVMDAAGNFPTQPGKIPFGKCRIVRRNGAFGIYNEGGSELVVQRAPMVKWVSTTVFVFPATIDGTVYCFRMTINNYCAGLYQWFCRFIRNVRV